jgi:heparinase II/III-like protein
MPPARPRRKRVPLGRIREMSLTEMAYRGQQEAAKLIERLAPAASYDDPRAALEDAAPALASPDAAMWWLRHTAPARFFAGVANVDALTSLQQRLPDACADVIAAATTTIVERRFDLLGYRSLSFGDPIDWHLDPVWKRRSPLVHWSQIDPLDATIVGDSKIVWELNRHQWIVRLAQAWALTADERYAEAAIASIDGWLEANPPGTGINWASSLEVSFRLIAWSWTLLLLRDFAPLSSAWVIKVLAAIGMHAAHVKRYLSYYFSPNTHLTGEALGLFYAGVLLREFQDASRWRELGARILIAESQRQVSTDGVHFEQSTCYQQYTADIYVHFLLLSARNEFALPATVGDCVTRMIEFLLAVRQPDGSIPAIGDADGGALLPLSRRSPRDCKGLFATGAAMFRRPEFAWAAGTLAPDVIWLLGADGMRTFDALRPASPSGPASRVFPEGGYAVMRHGWDANAHQMIVDIGPLGCPVSSGHGHADLLSVQVSIFGEPCLVDAGNYCYTTESEWRDFFRGTSAHNTVTVEGQSQSTTAGPFGWRSRPRVRLREWHSTPELDFLDAEHDAFRTRGEAILHRRRVLFVKPGYWIVVDDLSGASQHQLNLTFQFAPMQVTLGPNRWARAQTPRGRALWVGPFTSGAVKTTLRRGELRPIRGWVAPDYGQRLAAPTLVYGITSALPCRVLTLLLPDAQALSSPPAVRLIYDAQGLPAGLLFERSGESVRVDERAVLVERE